MEISDTNTEQDTKHIFKNTWPIITFNRNNYQDFFFGTAL
jgi:hypothetical protein